MSYEGRDRYYLGMLQVANSATPRPANMTGATTCQRSGVCCWRRPCELHPGDPERLAAHLGITTQEVIRDYLVVDRLDHGVVLLPRRVQQDGGRYLSASQTYDIETPCVFLDQSGGPGSCRVQEAKPTGGAQWSCTMTAEQMAALHRPAWTLEELRAIGYEGVLDADDG